MIYLRCWALPICCLLLAVITAGCGKSDAPDPPVSRVELTNRLFETIKQKRDDEALNIIEKLLALEPDDIELMEMRDRIVSNRCSRKVQKLIDQGKLNQALALIRQERRQYPVLAQLRVQEDEVLDLINLQAAARKLAAAQNIADLAAALNTIRPLAEKYPQAKQLHNDIKKRAEDLTAMRNKAAAQERSKTQNAAPAAPAVKP